MKFSTTRNLNSRADVHVTSHQEDPVRKIALLRTSGKDNLLGLADLNSILVHDCDLLRMLAQLRT